MEGAVGVALEVVSGVDSVVLWVIFPIDQNNLL